MDPLLVQLKRVAGNRLFDIGWLAVAVVSLLRLAVVLPERAHRIDLAHYYTSSRLLLQTGHPYGVELAPLYQQSGFVVPEGIRQATNPPALLWLFAPFALLTPVPAFVAWATVQALALGVILWQTKRLLRGRLTPRAWRLLCLGTVASHPIYWHFCMSQTQLLLAALVLTALAWQRDGHHTQACLAVTLAGLLKLFPVILLPWFVWRSSDQWRGRVKTACAALALTVGMVLLTGWQQWLEFFKNGYPLVTGWVLDHSYNYTLPSLVINLACPRATPVAAQVWWATGILLGLLLIAAAYALCLRRPTNAELEFSLLSVAMLAGSLVAWGHYLVFLIFPIAVWVTRLAASPSLRKLAVCALALVLLSIGPQRNAFLLAHPYLNIVVNWIPLFGLLIMGLALTHWLRGAKPQSN